MRNNDRVLVIGTGKVSNIIATSSAFANATFIGRKYCDITSKKNIRATLNAFTPNVVINCAAMTNLETCQENKSEAYLVNTMGPISLLKECAKRQIKLVHISSGCVFDGNEEISNEESPTTPSVWYTRTKVWADEFITNFGYENYLILRPRQLISPVPHPSNMITKFLDFERLDAIDEPNSITCIEDLVSMMVHLLDEKSTGIYNCANPGILSPYDIAIGIKEHLNPTLKVNKIGYEELLERLPNRRVNTILSIDKLSATGFVARPAAAALEWCLTNYGPM